jgi:hypothetical protein
LNNKSTLSYGTNWNGLRRQKSKKHRLFVLNQDGDEITIFFFVHMRNIEDFWVDQKQLNFIGRRQTKAQVFSKAMKLS